MVVHRKPSKGVNEFQVCWYDSVGNCWEKNFEDYREAVEFFNILTLATSKQIWGWKSVNGVCELLVSEV